MSGNKRTAREALPAETLERMLLAIIGGEAVEVNNEAERKLRDDITRDVQEIRDRGGIIDIPIYWPDI